MQGFGDIDLNVLRGWREKLDPALRAKHALPPLARLVRLDVPHAETIHGPDVLIGRYHPQHGPVDVIPQRLEDHQNYRLGAPHLHLTLDDRAGWGVRSLSPNSHTTVDGARLLHGASRRPIESGAEITLGHVRYRFERSGVTLSKWEEARARLLSTTDGPALFLCRRGGPCGPFVTLGPLVTFGPLNTVGERQRLVVGRSFPRHATLAGEQSWDGRSQPDWDLAGLYEPEKKLVAFEHAHLERAHSHETRTGGVVLLRPVASRRQTFVNRLEIIDQTPLSSGDEVALGSVIFYLHDPGQHPTPQRKAIEPPAVIDWQEGSTPLLDDTHDEDGR